MFAGAARGGGGLASEAFERSAVPRAVVRVSSLEPSVAAANAAWRDLAGVDAAAGDEISMEALAPDPLLRGVVDALATGRPVETVVVEFGDGRLREVTCERTGPFATLALEPVGEYNDATWLREVVDNTNHPMYVKDLDGRYLFVNRRWYASYGHLHRHNRGPIGYTDAEIFPPDIAGPVRANDLRVIELGKPCEFEERAPTSDGLRWFVSLKFPLRDAGGHHFATAGVSTDITHRKEMEAALIDAREQTMRAYEERSGFLSRMSHELRTPLNALLGFAQILREADTLDLTSRATVDRMLVAGNHLHSLIGEVLDLSAAESARQTMHVEAVDAAAVIREVVDLVRPLAAQRELSVAVDLHGAMFRHISANSRRLRQVLLNLLGNAVKYAAPHGRVAVTTTHNAERARLRVVVADDGPGLSPDQAERAFLPFERLDDAVTGDTEGSGLGLAVARSLTEAMGGTIGVEPTPPGEVGARFFVEFPLVDCDQAVARTLFPDDAAEPEPLPHGTRLVYIEDHPDNVAVMEGIIARADTGVTLRCASDARSGMDTVREVLPDAVLLDFNLPDLPGEHVLGMLMGDPELAAIPVVVVSADATPERVRRAMEAGAAAYLTKPLSATEVRRTLSEVVRAR